MMPPPIPVPRVRHIRLLTLRPAPLHFSPNAAAFASLSRDTGRLMALSINDLKGTSLQPGKLGDVTTIPLSNLMIPGEPIPTATTLLPFLSSRSISSLTLPVIQVKTRSFLRPFGISICLKLRKRPSLVTTPARTADPPKSTPITASPEISFPPSFNSATLFLNRRCRRRLSPFRHLKGDLFGFITLVLGEHLIFKGHRLYHGKLPVCLKGDDIV